MQFKEHSSIGKFVLAAMDAVLVLAAFSLAYGGFALRYAWRYGGVPPPPADYVWLVPVFIVALLLLLNHYGLLVIDRSRPAGSVAVRVGRAFLITGVVLSGVVFLAKAKEYSRLLLALNWGFAFAFVLGEKLLLRALARRGVLAFGPPQAVVLVGEGPKAERAAALLRDDPGRLLAEEAVFDLSVGLDAFESFLLARPTDVVLFALPRDSTRDGFRIDAFLQLCERLGVPAHVLVNLGDVLQFYSTSFSQLDGQPMLVFHPPGLDPDRALVKRTVDVAGAAVGLAVTVVLTPLVALAILIDSGRPIFFHQERVGRNGRRFRIHKFRTMAVGAEGRKAALAELNEMDGPIFKIAADPRVTRAGRVLRRLNLDELPQFWNVLKGEMSLVGTRPPTPDEVEHYEAWHYRRISIRPGITGLWQVSGAHRIRDFQEIVRLDLKYIDEWSLWLDVKILARTLLCLGRGR